MLRDFFLALFVWVLTIHPDIPLTLPCQDYLGSTTRVGVSLLFSQSSTPQWFIYSLGWRVEVGGRRGLVDPGQ